MSEQYWSGTPDKSPDQDAYEAAEAGTEEVSGTYRDAVHGVLALPKNIRQMGHPGQSHVVYIEDYVYTYLHMFLKEKYKDDTLRVAVLAGAISQLEDQTCVFVSGAISCEFSALHMETQETLTELVQKHFDNAIPLGWYIGCDGQDSHIQSVVKHYYAQMDAVVPGYVIYEDDVTGDMNFFCWEQNAMHPMGGYYIYYEKNPQMQEFLIAEKRALRADKETGMAMSVGGEIPVRQNDDFQKSMSEQIAKHYAREELSRLAEKKERITGRKPQKVVYAACAAALIIAAATGVSQIGNYQSLKNFQETVSRMAGNSQQTAKDPGKDTKDASMDTVDVQSQNTDAGAGKNAGSEAGGQVNDATENNESETSDVTSVEGQNAGALTQNNGTDISRDSSETASGAEQGGTISENGQSSVWTDGNGAKYYIVQKGDSLMSISRKLYQSIDQVREIKALNNMLDTDVIYEGQQLRVP